MKHEHKPARKRRGRGEGAVYRRKDGIWVSSISLGYGADGKRRRRTVYGSTKAEVLEKLRKIDPDNPGSGSAPATVARYLAGWLESVKSSVEPTTWERYEQHVRLHIDPRIGGVQLARLTTAHVEVMLAELARADVSPAMVKKVGVTLRTALAAAVDRKLIPANPATAAPLPKVSKYVPRVFTLNEIGRFQLAAAADRFEALYWLAIDSGCRQGELLALLWSDVDLTSGILTVTKALANQQGRTWVKEVKTAKSRRAIALGLSLDTLRRHRERMAAEGWDIETGIMFPSTVGTYVCKGNLHTRYFLPTLKRAGLPAIRFHDLRHCCASLLLAAGVDAKVVSERLGHASAAFTQSTYQHVLPGLQAQAAERLKKILTPESPAAGSNVGGNDDRKAAERATGEIGYS